MATNLLEGNHVSVNYEAIPSVVFTLPPLARVGWGEDEARVSGVSFVSDREDTATWHSSRRVGETFSGFNVLVEAASGRIFGAHVLASCRGDDQSVRAGDARGRDGQSIQGRAVGLPDPGGRYDVDGLIFAKRHGPGGTIDTVTYVFQCGLEWENPWTTTQQPRARLSIDAPREARRRIHIFPFPCIKRIDILSLRPTIG